MLYGDIYKVPAQTTAKNPCQRLVKVTKGVIKGWVISGAEEKADLLHVCVLYHGHRIVPYGELEWMYPLDTSSPIAEKIELDTAPFELEIQAYNEDDSYSHEYIIYAIIEPEEPTTAGHTAEAGWWETIKGMLGVE